MIEIKIPELAESITEGTIAKWMVKEGDEVSAGDVLLELETDKVNMEISAEDDGIIDKIKSQEGDTVHEGETVALLRATSATDDQASSENEAVKPEPTQAQSVNKPAALPSEWPTQSPSARKRAREQGQSLQQHSGHHLQSEQFRQESNKTREPDDRSESASRAVSQVQDPAKPEERIRMTRRRQTIAARLVEAQQTAAMLTTFNEIDMTAILELRKRKKEAFVQKHGVKLGFMSFFTSAVIGALKAYPMLNAEIAGDEIVLKKYYDIGIAVSTDEGLVVPVLRQADKLNFAEMEREIALLAEKARHNKLQLSDLQGGTFTITNGGIFGSLLSTPILNTPQVGILGMHKIQNRPVTLPDGQMANRPMMYVALSYDHRIVDGKEAVSFLVRVKQLLEDPEELLLEG